MTEHNHPDNVETQKSLSQLFSDLSNDLSTLIRQEIELAKTETLEKFNTTIRSVILLIAGGIVAYAGVIILLIALSIFLGIWMPYWLSTLIVGLAALVIGGIMLIVGKNAITNLSVVPEKTVETIKEDAQWAKEQVS